MRVVAAVEIVHGLFTKEVSLTTIAEAMGQISGGKDQSGEGEKGEEHSV